MNLIKIFFVIPFFIMGISLPYSFAQTFKLESKPLELKEIFAEIQGKNLKLLIRIPEGAHVYSVFLPTDHGPIPTKLFLTPKIQIKSARLIESKAVELYDEAFQVKTMVHKNEMALETDLGEVPMSKPVTGFIEYQICNNSICSLPQKLPFSAY
ncbi:MAG: protein-disulfide reductase DsbD family protein [SAR324 cluster bacterium]|nr:protein-disulfide reductase DsbD family protein [SAR324 cluster bacterium]